MRSFWKLLIIHSIALWFALQPSYLHPDEHFQSLEILCERLYHFKGSIPWEFDSENAARSFVPLFTYYGPIMCIIKFLMNRGFVQQPMSILRVVRGQNYLLYMVISKITLAVINSNLNALVAESFVMTSYVTLAYQSHSFSNSTETILLLLVLAIYKKLIESKSELQNHYLKSLFLGVLITLGIFNRITFPGFILLPSIPVFLQFYLNHRKSLSCLLVSLAVSTFAFIQIDTYLYGSPTYVVTPFNNLIYNLDESNLALHGLHPRFTHLLVNLPQVAGPAIILLPGAFKSFERVYTNIATLSLVSGIAILSLFKHQELRFIIPLAPLLFSCFVARSPFRIIKWQQIFRLWILFNLIMGAIMCCFHQGGILPALNQFYLDKRPIGVHIWWKTYSPPTWMYMNENLTVSTTNFIQNLELIDDVPFDITSNHVVDLKGSDVELLIKALTEFENNGALITLIAPNSVKGQLASLESITSFKLAKQDEWISHLDLDHIDFSNLGTITPGLASYHVTVPQ